MAKVYLDSTDTAFTVASSNVEVFGASGTQAVTVNSASLTGVKFDQNVESVVFAGNTSDYRYQQAGASLKVYDSTGAKLIATVATQADADGTQLTFANGTVKAALDASSVMKFGDVTVNDSAPVTVTPTTISTTTTSTGTTVATGSVFTLSTAADVLGPNSTSATAKTTSGDDTVYGLTASSLTSSDVIDASGGTDKLVADYDLGAGDLTIAPVLTSVEDVTLKATGTTNAAKTLTFDAANSTGITSVTFDTVVGGATAMALVAQNLGSGVSLGIKNATSAAGADTYTFKYADAALSGSADTVTLNVTANTTATGAVVIQNTTSTATGSGAETVSIVTSGTGTSAASTLASVSSNDGGATSVLKTLKIAGTSNLTISNTLDFAGTTGGTIDASGMSGNLTLTATSGNEPITFTGGSGKNTITVANGSDTLTGGANDDTFTIGTGNDTVTGGAGNDTVNVTVAGLTTGSTADVINLGDGTRDAIMFSDPATLNSATVSSTNLTAIAAVSGLEVIGSSAADVTAIDAGYFTQTIYRLTGSLAKDLAVTNVAGDTLELRSNIAANTNSALTVSGALPNQTFGLEFNGAASTVIYSKDGAGADAGLAIASGISTVNIVSTTTATSTTGLVNGISAHNDATLDATAATNATYAVNNVSAGSIKLTGNVDFKIDGGKTAGFSKAIDFDASAFTGKLTIVGSESADVIKGGTAKDTITGGLLGDVLTGGTGDDSFVLAFTKTNATANDSLTATYDKITDFTKAATSTAASGFDTITVTEAGATAITVTANVTAAAGVTNGIKNGKFTFDKAAATSLSDAITKVGADVATSCASVVFEYGGNSYLYIDSDAGTGTAKDMLVELTGVTGLSGVSVAAGVFTIY